MIFAHLFALRGHSGAAGLFFVILVALACAVLIAAWPKNPQPK